MQCSAKWLKCRPWCSSWPIGRTCNVAQIATYGLAGASVILYLGNWRCLSDVDGKCRADLHTYYAWHKACMHIPATAKNVCCKTTVIHVVHWHVVCWHDALDAPSSAACYKWLWLATDMVSVIIAVVVQDRHMKHGLTLTVQKSNGSAALQTCSCKNLTWDAYLALSPSWTQQQQSFQRQHSTSWCDHCIWNQQQAVWYQLINMKTHWQLRRCSDMAQDGQCWVAL